MRISHRCVVSFIAVLFMLFISSMAYAADTAAPAGAAQPVGAAGIIAAIAAGLAAVVTAAAALVSASRSGRAAAAATEHAATATATATVAVAQSAAADARAAAAETRAAAAAQWADRLASAHQDGVVLLLTYPGVAKSSRELLTTNGWRVLAYAVTDAELARGELLPGGERLLADVAAADAVVVEGLDEAHVAQLAGMRDLRDRVRAGASVCLYTGGRNYRYDLTLWGECDQGVTMPVTVEAAVRGSLARREATSRRQGIRPGQLAAAREALIHCQ
jgi:hypothetical protein